MLRYSGCQASVQHDEVKAVLYAAILYLVVYKYGLILYMAVTALSSSARSAVIEVFFLAADSRAYTPCNSQYSSENA